MLTRPERRSGRIWVPAAQALLGAAALAAVGYAAFHVDAVIADERMPNLACILRQRS